MGPQAGRNGSRVATMTKDGKGRAIFAAGCFWGVEASFRKIPGVEDAQVGYTGGDAPSPTYEQVCTGTTGHAEAVEVTYDPDRVSYEELLEAFWGMHDPTQVDRQGPDIGSQYRSAIFCVDEDQRKLAQRSKGDLEARNAHGRPVATEIADAGEFWRAEEYHQRYLERRVPRYRFW